MEMLDKKILDLFVANRNIYLSPFMHFLSSLAEIKTVILILTILSIYFCFKREIINIFYLLTSVGLSISTTLILKNVFDRARPSVEALTIENSFAFPSAHSTIAASLYGFILFWIIKSKLPFKKIWALILILIILLIGISRLYLGVHYLSDIIAGYLVGFSSLLIALGVSKLNSSPLRGDKHH